MVEALRASAMQGDRSVWEWITQNSQTLNTVLNAGMVAIWVFYLQVFLVSYRRQKRTVLHLDRGAADDETARCIVTNMGQEPTYIAAIVVDLIFEDRRERALVTDRHEMPDEKLNQPLEKTNKGPLASGEARDVGSFWDLAERAHRRLDIDVRMEDLRAMEVMAVAASNQAQKLIGGYKRFSVFRSDQIRAFAPEQVITRQIWTPWRRRRLMRLIDERPRERA